MDANPEWSDSWYFNFHDQAAGLTAFMRIGSKPNKDEKTMFLFFVRDGSVLGMRRSVSYVKGKERECGGLTFETRGGEYRLAYRGPVANAADQSDVHVVDMDVVWEPVNPEFDYHECVDAKGAELSSKVASEHFEQFGRAKGFLSIDGARGVVDGWGERDRSEGVREWGSPKMWYWLNSVYDGKVGFNVTKLCTGMGDVDAGYFGTARGNDPVVKSEIETEYDGKVPESFTIRATGKSGRTYEVSGRVLRHAALPMASGAMMLVETVAETTYDGKTGHGVAEFLVRNA